MPQLPQEVINEAIRRLERGESMRQIALVLTIAPTTVNSIKKRYAVQLPEKKIRRSNYIWMPLKDASRIHQRLEEEAAQLSREQDKWRAVIKKHAARATVKEPKKVETVKETASKTVVANAKVKSTRKRKRDQKEDQEPGVVMDAGVESKDGDKATEVNGRATKKHRK